MAEKENDRAIDEKKIATIGEQTIRLIRQDQRANYLWLVKDIIRECEAKLNTPLISEEEKHKNQQTLLKAIEIILNTEK